MRVRLLILVFLLIILILVIFVQFPSILALAEKHANLITAFAMLFSVLVALYLGELRECVLKPKLSIVFDNSKKYPFYQKLSYGAFKKGIDFGGYKVDISIPGFNARVKINNDGDSTAKKVEARVEKIEFYENSSIKTPSAAYHPTAIKWSGEFDWKPVNINQKSHFFLDIFWVINETIDEIVSFNTDNLKIYGVNIEKEILRKIVKNHIKPSGEIYWNVWVQAPQLRGLPARYTIEGDIHIYFIINGENCDSLKFKAIVHWSSSLWDSPSIEILH
jgi:hypothetical protein